MKYSVNDINIANIESDIIDIANLGNNRIGDKFQELLRVSDTKKLFKKAYEAKTDFEYFDAINDIFGNNKKLIIGEYVKSEFDQVYTGKIATNIVVTDGSSSFMNLQLSYVSDKPLKGKVYTFKEIEAMVTTGKLIVTLEHDLVNGLEAIKVSSNEKVLRKSEKNVENFLNIVMSDKTTMAQKQLFILDGAKRMFDLDIMKINDRLKALMFGVEYEKKAQDIVYDYYPHYVGIVCDMVTKSDLKAIEEQYYHNIMDQMQKDVLDNFEF